MRLKRNGVFRMNNIKKELIYELRQIWDNKDFVCGAMSNAGSEKAWEEMYNYLISAKESGDKVTSDEILLMSIGLSSGNDFADKRITAVV